MYKMKASGWAKHYDFLFLDLICLHLSFLVSYMLRHGLDNPYNQDLYRNMAIFITIADIAVLLFFETLKGVMRRSWSKEFTATLRHVTLVILLCILYLFLTQEGQDYSRITMLLTGIVYLTTTYLARILHKHMLLKTSRAENLRRTMLIVTTSDLAEEITHQLINVNFGQFSIPGIIIIDKDMVGQEIEGIPVVANRRNAVKYMCHEWVDEIFAAFSKDMPYPQKLINQFSIMGVTVHERLRVNTDGRGDKHIVEKVGGFTVLTTSINYATTWQTLAKRLIDLVGGLVGCIATGLLCIVVGPMIYAASPGPIFFAQERVGQNGKKFKIYKFRTMYMDAEERKKELMKENKIKDGMMFKMDFDPRIIGNRILPDGTQKTGIGQKLRSMSLDEFPQFLNVLKGDMSLVGTRPPTTDEWEKYDLHHRARLAIKPGITGMWQVSGRSNITDFEEVVRLDTQYISEWNLGLDFKILFKTLITVFKKEGSI